MGGYTEGMRLTELEPRFIQFAVTIAYACHGRKLDNGEIQWGGFEVDSFIDVPTFAEAHGIIFICPLEFKKNNGVIGSHSVQVFFHGKPVPPHIGKNSQGQMVRWTATGTGFEDLTLTPSIFENGNPPCWHGFITNGDVSIV